MPDIDPIMSYFRTALGKETGISQAFIRELVEDGPFNLDEETLEQIIRELEASFDITQLTGAAITGEEYVPWLEARKPEIDFFFWERLKRFYIETGSLPPHVVNTLDQVTDEILDWCGDPQSPDLRWKKRGMVLGHVQSGKTTNYSALISKAADAGYEIIILLAGLTNSLRSQTQERIDETFIGKRSVFEPAADTSLDIQKYGAHPRSAAYGTSRLDDFTIKRAGGWGISIGQIVDPLIFITKKNKNVLEGLADWLKQQNPGDLIDHPLLLIDDEADNASINTSKDPRRVTAINEAIRSILEMFSKSSYVGYTATPFANIFIDPDTDDDMLGDDLFPVNFIKALDPPTNYIGATKIFDEDGEFRERTVQIVKDFSDVLPLKHKKDHPLDVLPPSLNAAIRAFVVARAIRVLRGDGKKHASMMINVSRFNDVQEKVEGLVYEYLDALKNAITTHAGRGTKGLRDTTILDLRDKFEAAFAGCGFEWPEVQGALSEAVRSIVVRTVNMRKGGKLDYSANLENGLHVIAIGGLALSRGLTLEGLSTSYILRNASASDTLMQMARWFGYRPGYEDLCRVYLPRSSVGHYEFVTEATEELRTEIKRMEALKMTPRDFGLRVRHSPAVIRITAANKMQTAQSLTIAADFQGRHVEGYVFPNNGEVLRKNLTEVDTFVDRIGSAVPSPKGWTWSKVSGRQVLEILSALDFGGHPDLGRIERERSLLYDYISDRITSEMADWDVILPTNQWSVVTNTYDAPMEAYSEGIVPIMKRRAGNIVDGSYKVTRKNKVASPGDESLGFSDEEARRITAKSQEQETRKSTEFCLARERPLLIVHMFNGIVPDDPDFRDAPPEGWDENDRLASLSFLLPATQVLPKARTYAVNTVYRRQLDLFSREEEDDDEEILDAAERE
jgi:hypothetical protein